MGESKIDVPRTPAPPAAALDPPVADADSGPAPAQGAVPGDAFSRSPPAAERRVAAPLALVPPPPGGVRLRGLGVIPGSVLSPAGAGNVAGGDPNLLSLGGARDSPDDRRTPGLAPRGGSDPARVAETDVGGVDPAIRALVAAHADAHTVADAIAGLHGPYRADNTPANRAAILAALRFITKDGTGLTYDHARAAAHTSDTQSPNRTMTRGQGVCRDFATASAAILASLIDARRVGGTWTAGSPNGREDQVQAFSFDNPAEYHAFTSYRDPLSGTWSTLEYGTSYTLAAPTSPDAIVRSMGGASGFMIYRINGWDGAPALAARGVLDAAKANAFFDADPGAGKTGELYTSAGASEVAATWFATPRLALVGSVDPSALANGLRAGLKLNYHDDFTRLPDGSGGYLRLAGGVYTDYLDASRATGDRAAADRARYQVLVVGLQFDGRDDLAAWKVASEHLRLQLGADWSTRLGVPLRFGPGASTLSGGAVADYSQADVGADASLAGSEQLSPEWRLDWALRLRGQADLILAGTEAMTGGSVRQSLLRDPWRATFGLALSRASSSGPNTRIEVGGTQFLAAPLDPSASPSGTHHAVLSVAPGSGVVNFGVVARGETIDHRLVPVNALGVSLDLRPRDGLAVGASAETALPGGDWRQAGDRVSVSVSARLTL